MMDQAKALKAAASKVRSQRTLWPTKKRTPSFNTVVKEIRRAFLCADLGSWIKRTIKKDKKIETPVARRGTVRPHLSAMKPPNMEARRIPPSLKASILDNIFLE